MPIAETVVALADCIATARAPLSDWERSLHAALLLMPKHRDAGTLDEWEGLFRDSWREGANTVENPDGYFETCRLFGKVFELGRHNLYTAFSAPRGVYNTLVRELNVHHNIPAPDDLDVSEW